MVSPNLSGRMDRYVELDSDTTSTLYSSRTTEKIKGVVVTHRNIIAKRIRARVGTPGRTSSVVQLCTVPYFHVYGFIYCMRLMTYGDSMVSTRRFDMELMLRPGG
ncbi:hypothetical protein RJ639_017188 [Escallonia herrerae]|uniref:AMP-dependent synthetase/ligase domain-containing protein n=1 Tax=Escallonia herrerae TaxID=1293975 RepID=A0AA88VDN4_9ASTE|nr:hypothetical protein RJ639_017188 [Escallonia herrerae]